MVKHIVAYTLKEGVNKEEAVQVIASASCRLWNWASLMLPAVAAPYP